MKRNACFMFFSIWRTDGSNISWLHYSLILVHWKPFWLHLFSHSMFFGVLSISCSWLPIDDAAGCSVCTQAERATSAFSSNIYHRWCRNRIMEMPMYVCYYIHCVCMFFTFNWVPVCACVRISVCQKARSVKTSHFSP